MAGMLPPLNSGTRNFNHVCRLELVDKEATAEEGIGIFVFDPLSISYLPSPQLIHPDSQFSFIRSSTHLIPIVLSLKVARLSYIGVTKKGNRYLRHQSHLS